MRKIECGVCGRKWLLVVILAALAIGLGVAGAGVTATTSRQYFRAAAPLTSQRLTAAVPRQEFEQTAMAAMADSRTGTRMQSTVDDGSRAINDLRVFLANMARAKHDGNSIGITADASGVTWFDDKVPSTK